MEQAQITSNKPSTPAIKFDYWTEEILQLLPIDANSLIFSGDLLFKLYLNTQIPDLNLVNSDSFEFIDLYLFGSGENKIKIVENIINILQTIFEQHVIAGASDANQINIIIQGVPRIIRLANTNLSNISEIFNSSPFAHMSMYWSNQGLWISPFAKYSFETNQVLPNPNAKFRATLNDLVAVRKTNMQINQYISEFPMVEITKSNPKEKTITEIKKFYVQQKNLQCRDDVFKLINYCGLRQVPLGNYDFLSQILYNLSPQKNENFLDNFSNQNYLVNYEKSSSSSFTRGIFSEGNLNKIILDVHVEDCYKFGVNNTYFYFLSINNPDMADKFKQMVQFCLSDLENSRTCILDSAALDDNARAIFNVANSTPSFAHLDVTTNIEECVSKCKQLDKLCFLAISDKSIESDQDLFIIFTLYNLKKTAHTTTTNGNYEKVFIEVYSVL